MLAYAIRHAESVANVERNETVNLDAPLSNLGRRQSAALADRLSRAPISAIYTSPYSRCIETAKPLAEALGLPIYLLPELCEFHYFPVDAKPPSVVLDTFEGIMQRHPQVRPCPDHLGAMAWPPVKESVESLVNRLQNLATLLKTRWQASDEAVVLISHGSPIAWLIEAWLTGDPGRSYRFVIDNAAMTALRFFDEVSSLICLNEISHLHGLPAPATANYCEDGSLKAEPATAYH